MTGARATMTRVTVEIADSADRREKSCALCNAGCATLVSMKLPYENAGGSWTSSGSWPRKSDKRSDSVNIDTRVWRAYRYLASNSHSR
jgi:hypothetical protein